MQRKIGLIMLVFATANVLLAQTYAVHLSPPVNAGQFFAVSVSGSHQEQISSGGRALREMEYETAFRGRAEVISVDRGDAVRLTFTVESFTKKEGGVTTELLQPGSVIVVDGSLDPQVFLKGSDMEPSVREAFRQVFTPHKPGDATDQEIFGPTETKAIGESWPINAARLAESLRDAGIIVRPDGLSGRVSLVARDKVDGADCLSLLAEVKAEDFLAKDLPPEATGRMQATFRGCFPMDDSTLSYREGADMAVRMHFTGPKGTPLEGVAVEVMMSEKKEGLWLALGAHPGFI